MRSGSKARRFLGFNGLDNHSRKRKPSFHICSVYSVLLLWPRIPTAADLASSHWAYWTKLLMGMAIARMLRKTIESQSAEILKGNNEIHQQWFSMR